MKPFVITAGEPAGIGPDCILRAWVSHKQLFSGCVVAAPSCWLQERAALMGFDVAMQEYSSLEAANDAVISNDTKPVLVCWNPVGSAAATGVRLAKPSPDTAAAVIACIEAAAHACLAGDAAAMITGPIEKAVLRSAGFNFPGHTEFLAHLASEYQADNECGSAAASRPEDFVMMLASDQIRVALLTTHMALRAVPDAINTVDTLKCLRIVDHDMRHRFGISRPRLALCALNPHAGEQGHFGREEIDMLAPAAEQARAAGIVVSDPLPADTVFSANVRKDFDAIICCYHDQALIPLKTLSFGEAVNVTLGLPFIRTSVDHGTALDRVGSDEVSCSSLVAAIHMARQMSQAG